MSLLQSCQAGPTSLLLGWAVQKQSRDFLHRVGHCDLKCSGSTSAIPPLAMEVLPNSLNYKTYSPLPFRGCFQCFSLQLRLLGPTHPHPAPTCPLTSFFYAPGASFRHDSGIPTPGAVSLLPAIIHPEHVSKVGEPVATGTVRSLAVLQEPVVRPPCC